MPKEIFGPEYPFLKSSQFLSFDEIVQIVAAAVPLGIEKVRLTGGEPLLRRKTPELVRRIKEQAPIDQIALTTNGMLLVPLLEDFVKAGLNRVNISFDAVEDSIFRSMSGGFGDSATVMRAIQQSAQSGILTKVNAVIKKDVNDDQIVPLIEFGMETGVELRFIEFMDVGTSNQWDEAQVVSKDQILEQVSRHFSVQPCPSKPFEGVANRFQLREHDYHFGIISSVSAPFCGSCVRARLSSDGKLYTCLFSNNGHDLKEVLRNGDQKLRARIRKIWNGRHDRYSELRDSSKPAPAKAEMSYLGG